MTLAALFLAPCAVRADVVTPPVPPSTQMVLNGTLLWDGSRGNNGTTGLVLTMTTGEAVHLGQVAKSMMPNNCLGKRVAVTILGSSTLRQTPVDRVFHRQGHTVTHVETVVSIARVNGH